MKKWYQKSIAVVMAAACLFAGGTIGLARDSLPQLQLTAEAEEAEDKLYTGESDGLQLEYKELEDGTIEITKFVDSTSTDIELPAVIDGKSVTSIGYGAFAHCKNLTSIILPDGVTSIRSGVFSECISLISITIPKNVEDIDNYAFSGCCNLKEFIVDPDNSAYTSQDGVLFDKNMETLLHCPAGKSGIYTIPSGVASIGFDAFSGCSGLTSITVPESVTSIEGQAFVDCSNLTSVILSNGLKSIDTSAFLNCTSLTSITIPESVTDIGTHVFYYCDSLESVTILSNHITSITPYMFYGCSNLKNVEIPESVTDIGYAAFLDCTSLENITIPESVTAIRDCAFGGCDSLKSIFIPKNVTDISLSAWAGLGTGKNKNLEEIIIDSDNPSYASEDGVLFDKNMETLLQCPIGKSGIYTIPMGVTSIGEGAFSYCDNLTNVIIPESVTSIGNSAFDVCMNLTSITIPESVTNIEDDAFRYCMNLTEIMVASNNPSYTSEDGILFDKSMGTLLECPAGKSGVYTIPIGVTNIGDRAFQYCENLENIIIPDSVTSIGEYTFSNCDNLTDIYYNGTETEWNQISMDTSTVPSSVTIHYNSEPTTTTTTTATTTPSESTTTTTTVKPNLTNIRGDVNGNNLVEVSDAVEVLKYYAKKAAGLDSVFSETAAENEAIFNLADVDKDGEITVQDAVLILTYYAKAASGGQPTWEQLTSA
ncbi:MAG: leucine-rich repeat protein [Ruminococcus sp.]|nr:leucine-rich repeat protein [Ruminococcus sp.]